MSSRSARTKAKKRAFVKAHTKSRTAAAKAAEVVIQNYRMAKLRPGAAGVYRALLNPRVQGFLGLEKKYLDTRRISVEIVTDNLCANMVYNPSYADINHDLISAPQQGPGPTQRIGKSITIKSVQVRGSVNVPGVTISSSFETPYVFLALVHDTQTNGAQCTGPDVFTNPGAVYHTLVTPFRNLINSKRFKILKSACLPFPVADAWYTGSANVSSGTSVTFDWYLPCEIPVNFTDGTEGKVANVVDNSLHVLAAVSTGPHITGPPAYLDYSARIRFLG